MKTYTQDEIDSHFEKLPKVLQDALFDPKIARRIFAVGDQFELTIEKIGFLAEETGFVMLGFIHPNMFKNTLKERLGIDDTKAQSIAHEINNQVFFPLREIMKSALGMDIVLEKTARPEKPAAFPIPSVPMPPIQPQKPLLTAPQPKIIDLRMEAAKEILEKDKKPEERIKETGEGPESVKSKIPFFGMRPVPKEPLPRQSEIPKKLEVMPGGGILSLPTEPPKHEPPAIEEKMSAPPQEQPKHDEARSTKYEVRGDELQPLLKSNSIEKNPPTKEDPYKEQID